MAYADVVKALSPYLYYPLDDAASPPVDRSGNGRNALSSTGIDYAQSGIRPATSLAAQWGGGSDTIRPHEGVSLVGRVYSVAFWFRLSSATIANGIALFTQTHTNSTGLPLAMFIYGSQVRAQAKAGSTTRLSAIGPTVSGGLLAGTTYFAAIASDATSATVYCNGVAGNSANWSGVPDGAGQPYSLGNASDPYWDKYQGKMSDFAMWDRKLTAAEITTLYRAGLRDGILSPFGGYGG